MFWSQRGAFKSSLYCLPQNNSWSSQLTTYISWLVKSTNMGYGSKVKVLLLFFQRISGPFPALSSQSSQLPITPVPFSELCRHLHTRVHSPSPTRHTDIINLFFFLKKRITSWAKHEWCLNLAYGKTWMVPKSSLAPLCSPSLYIYIVYVL